MHSPNQLLSPGACRSSLYCGAYGFAIGPHFPQLSRLDSSYNPVFEPENHERCLFAMNLDPDILRRLRAAPEILNQIAAWSGSELALQDRLRVEFPADLVRGALTLVELRRRATAK